MNSDLLVPLDGSKAAENVLPVAAAVSAAYGLSIRFLEAVDTSQRGPTGHPDPVRSEAMFREYTEDLAARHHLDRASWHAASVVGDPAEVILAAAEHAAMVAIATHGHGGFRSAVLGSVADRVVRGTPHPIFVVPAVGPAPAIAAGPVVVALDGSSESAQSLPCAREAAERFHRGILLLQAYSSVVPAMTAETGYYPPSYLEDIEAGAQASLAEVALPGEQYRALPGPIVEAISSAAVSVDAALLVIGSSGKGLAKRLTIGSTTSGLLHSYRRPMLVVPRSAG